MATKHRGETEQDQAQAPAKRTSEERLARKQAAGLRLPVEPSTELLAMTVEELNALSDDLDRQRSAIMEQKRAVHESRTRLLKEEQADLWGVDVAEYDAAKAKAKEDGVSLGEALNNARKAKRLEARKAQAATAKPAHTRGKAK
jgi:hypothetical protein